MTKDPVTLIVVDSDGEIITCANGVVSSDNPELVKQVKRSPNLPWKVQLVPPSGRKIHPSLDPNDLIGVTAALYSANPGRTRLLEAPSEVKEWFQAEYERYGGGCLPEEGTAPSYSPRSIEEIARGLGRAGKYKGNS